LTPPTDINQVELTPPTAVNQVKLTPPTAVNQVESTPPTSVNQVEPTPPIAVNQVQLTPPTTLHSSFAGALPDLLLSTDSRPFTPPRSSPSVAEHVSVSVTLTAYTNAAGSITSNVSLVNVNQTNESSQIVTKISSVSEHEGIVDQNGMSSTVTVTVKHQAEPVISVSVSPTNTQRQTTQHVVLSPPVVSPTSGSREMSVVSYSNATNGNGDNVPLNLQLLSGSDRNGTIDGASIREDVQCFENSPSKDRSSSDTERNEHGATNRFVGDSNRTSEV